MAEMDIALTMTAILGTLIAMVGGLIMLQTPQSSSSSSTSNPDVDGNNNNNTVSPSSFFPCPKTQPSKRAYEVFVAYYTIVWMTIFGMVVVFQWYETFDAMSYLLLCGGLALPLLLQPILYPSVALPLAWATSATKEAPSSSSFVSRISPDAHRPWHQRYSTKANIWMIIYSFIGNYWYTHYFYTVLHAKYTMPSHRFNNVPVAMIFATHFYFSSYHFFSNALLRKINTTYRPGVLRNILFIATIVVFSYFTAFMETLTISSYPYYSFQDRTMAYTVGSAFYGIYFLVSFPAFYFFDNHIDSCYIINNQNNNVPRDKPEANNNKTNDSYRVMTIGDTILSSCGYGMIILTLLDFVRLYLRIPLTVSLSEE